MALQKISVRKVFIDDKNKFGEPYKSRTGKQMYRVKLFSNEYGDEAMTGMVPFRPDRWEGSSQELDVEKDEKWGLQFKLPPMERKGGGGASEEQMALLNRRLDTIITNQKILLSAIRNQTEEDPAALIDKAFEEQSEKRKQEEQAKEAEKATPPDWAPTDEEMDAIQA